MQNLNCQQHNEKITNICIENHPCEDRRLCVQCLFKTHDSLPREKIPLIQDYSTRLREKFKEFKEENMKAHIIALETLQNQVNGYFSEIKNANTPQIQNYLTRFREKFPEFKEENMKTPIIALETLQNQVNEHFQEIKNAINSIIDKVKEIDKEVLMLKQKLSTIPIIEFSKSDFNLMIEIVQQNKIEKITNEKIILNNVCNANIEKAKDVSTLLNNLLIEIQQSEKTQTIDQQQVINQRKASKIHENQNFSPGGTLKLGNFVIKQRIKYFKKNGFNLLGEIRFAIDYQTKNKVIVKLEPTCNQSFLPSEAQVYQELWNQQTGGTKRIPKIIYFGVVRKFIGDDIYMMAMEQLGPSLEQLFDICGRRFSLKTVLMLADQMIQNIDFVHSCHYLHRQINPHHFLIGTGKEAHILYLIDYSFVTKYIYSNGEHKMSFHSKLYGKQYFSSKSNHLGDEQGRKDDFESLGYVMMYFLRGDLPWQNVKETYKKQTIQSIQEKKLAISINQLCEGYPKELASFLKYLQNLKFFQKPDCIFLRNLLKNLFTKSGFEMDYIYDWDLIQKNDLAQSQLQQQEKQVSDNLQLSNQ